MSKTLTFFTCFLVVIVVYEVFRPYEFVDEINHAKTLDPMAAYTYLDDAEINYDNKNETLLTGAKGDWLWSEKFHYLFSAADQLEPEALDVLFNTNLPLLSQATGTATMTDLIDEWSNKRAQLASKVIAMSESSNDPHILSAAATIYTDGNYINKDTLKANAYLARAWSSGDAKVANRLGVSYTEGKDYKSAYLWSLRCIRECDRDPIIMLNSIEHLLSPDDIKMIQKLSLDNAVLLIDTKA